jgi:lysine-N-methylase
MRCREPSLRQSNLIRPSYAESFRCLGSACEETCCQGWNIHIDKATFDKYQALPAGPLASLIQISVKAVDPAATPANLAAFAFINVSPATGCPLQSEDHLCRVHSELGEAFLSPICASFPRRTQAVDGLDETTVSLACPEAARQVLLNTQLVLSAPAAQTVAWDDSASGNRDMTAYFWPIRQFGLNLILDRSYPLWQRLFLLGGFCQCLDAVARGEEGCDFPTLLLEFSETIGSGSLRTAMQRLPADPAVQLNLSMRLLKLCLGNLWMSASVADTIKDFRNGIGLNADSSFQSHLAGYAAAYQDFYAPFFLLHQEILENYLVDFIFRELFPFGRIVSAAESTFDASKAFTLLAARLVLIKSLLVGVAGAHKQAFSTEHVVHTIQSVSRHFEHNSKFFDQAYELLTANNLLSLPALTTLLRN